MSHPYLPINGRYLNAHQSLPATLARAPLRFTKHVGLGNGLRLLLHQLGVRKRRSPAIELPVPGMACVPTQRGYTVFRVDRDSVVDIFKPRVKPAVFEIYAAAAAWVSRLSFTPELLGVSREEQWLEMRYVPGQEGRVLLVDDAARFQRVFQSSLVPCLAELVLSEPPRFVPLAEYVDELTQSLNAESLAAWPQVEPLFRSFVQRISARLADSGHIALTFAHGDFVHVNMIVSGEGVRVIDWDTAGWRSILHDAHTFFFSQVFWRQDVPMPPVLLEQTIRDLAAALPAHSGWLSLTPQALDVYRRLYYLERLAMVLRRKKNKSRAEHLKVSIQIYEAFEAEIAAGDSRGSRASLPGPVARQSRPTTLPPTPAVLKQPRPRRQLAQSQPTRQGQAEGRPKGH
jgi:hypothetical protein